MKGPSPQRTAMCTPSAHYPLTFPRLFCHNRCATLDIHLLFSPQHAVNLLSVNRYWLKINSTLEETRYSSRKLIFNK